MPAQQPLIRASQPVLRKQGDDFEQRESHRVVQILGRKFFLSVFAEARAYIRGELRDRVAQNFRGRGHLESLLQSYSLAQRNPA